MLAVELGKASAVESLGGGRYGAALDPGWAVGTKPNGGYLLAVLTRAAVAEAAIGARTELPHPAAVSAHFLAAPDAGPAEITVEVLRQGRSASQARATLFAGGTRCVEALVTCGRLEPAGAPYWSAVEPPRLPPEQDCVRAPASDPRFTVPIFAEPTYTASGPPAGLTVASTARCWT